MPEREAHRVATRVAETVGRKSLLSVGALTHDHIMRFETLPRGPGKFISSRSVRIASGMAASAATAARRQGAEVALWASVGDDALADELIADISAEGVDCGSVRRVKGARSASATILVDGAGEHMIAVDYDPKTQADPDRFPFAYDRRFDAILADVRWPGAAAIALAEARARGVPGIFDADVAPAGALRRLAPIASHIIASDAVIAILWEGQTLTPPEAAQRLHQETGAFVAFTCGSRGTYWIDEGEPRHSPAMPIVPVDTLAAGDVFHGSFAVALAERWPLDRAIEFASVAAGIKCLTFGGRLGAPTRAETFAALEAD